MKKLLTGAAIVVIIVASVFAYYTVTSPYVILRDGETGKIIASYSVRNQEEFSIKFVHSVNNSPVTDVYRIINDRIYVVRTIYYSFGAGVQTEPEDGQILEYGEDGSMIVSGFNQPRDNLSYIVGTVSDHILDINGKSISLRELCGRNATVRFSCKRKLKFFNENN
ncbi:MAG: DUF1850 domain-containing protein [Clostridiaceae bacterium]|jgi:hypothetical protein|nr:DUF1850 domain-containing protein [Clostridiaceae bacterium]